MSINFEQVTKRYHGAPVLNDVSLRIEPGEFFVLLGPSGSGKSTLLRIAAGLTDVDHGRISFHGRDVTHVRARDRGVGLVFQHYALFRHMTVGENVEFALRVRGIKRRERARRRDELLQLVALEGYETRLPGQLSGGQQQRVAVARALAHEPQVLLLDEPFGALDAKIRVELRETIRQVQRRIGMTTILVTHDQEEAFALADRIGIMHNGRLLETGRAETLYHRPTTRFVATFLGAANLFLGERGPGGLKLGKRFLASASSARSAITSHEVVTVVRPEDIEIAEDEEQLRSGPLGTGHVLSVDFGGVLERLRVQIERQWEVISAIGREPAPSAAGTAAPAHSEVVEITRTSSEQGALALSPGKRVALGIRRFHLLPTPIASFRLLSTGAATAAALRRSPLLRALVQSMQAPVLEAQDGAEAPAAAARDAAAARTGEAAVPVPLRDAAQAGVGVIAGGAGSIAEIASAAAQGRRWLLCVPSQIGLPRRMLIHCNSEAARSETLRLVASVMRHLHAEATFVSVQSPSAPRSEATSAFRRLLDARAELQQTHGLDIRTEVHIGDSAGWAAQLAASAEPVLAVLGLDGAPSELEGMLASNFQPLFGNGSNCAVLLSCTGTPALPLEARALTPDLVFEERTSHALPGATA
ncbi:MAG TPA: ABC transporter ATP-binding protein [Steroidobacteraceae bacterium]|jgi:sulfate transport system ATP-binding protein|nr:ABC transporter ATP-binding protein [Steroidobacteraceae bacterium]